MGYEFTTENIQTYLNDVAGVRIVCAFIDDIYMISDLITQQDDIKVIEIKDYIKNPKSNGYRSYHMIVEIPVFFAKGKTPMRVELQILTNTFKKYNILTVDFTTDKVKTCDCFLFSGSLKMAISLSASMIALAE